MKPDRESVQAIAARQGQVVTTRQLVAVGADRSWIARRVTSGAWQRLHRGVFVTHSGPVPWRSRAWAALMYAGRGAALSHESAAFLHDFRPGAPRRLDVAIPASRRVMPSHGLVLHLRRQMPPATGRPAKVWPEDTVVDLVADVRTEDDAVGWLCDAVRAGCTPPGILDTLLRGRGVRRAHLLRELCGEVADGIESPLEHRYRRDVEQRHGLPRARLQVRQVVDGLWIRADAVYEDFGVRIELDGALAHPRGRTDRDTWRDNAVLILAHDLTLRYRWHHVAVTPCDTAAQVLSALRVRRPATTARACGPACAVGRV